MHKNTLLGVFTADGLMSEKRGGKNIPPSVEAIKTFILVILASLSINYANAKALASLTYGEVWVGCRFHAL